MPLDMPQKEREKIIASIQADWQDATIEFSKFEADLQRNHLLNSGAHAEAFGISHGDRQPYFTDNRIQNAIVTQTAVQTESAPRPVFQGRESNEPPEIFIRPEAAYTLAEAQDVQLSPEQLAGQAVIPQGQFDQIAAITVDQPVPNPRAGEPMDSSEKPKLQPDEVMVPVPVFSDDDFIFVTDALCAEALTQEHESEWEMSGCDADVATWIYETNVLGWADVFTQWDSEQNRFYLTPIYPYNGRIDRWARRMGDAKVYIHKQILELLEAKKLYPQYAAELEARPISLFDGGSGGNRGGRYDNLAAREVVERTTRWRRDVMFPKTVKEAIEAGDIAPAMQDEPQIDPATNQVVSMQTPVTDEQGQPVFQLEDGSLTAPDNDNWPERPGIEQTDTIGDHILYHGETEFADIPVARNVNIPVVESPYGYGEPHRLADLQELLNRLLGIFDAHARYYKSAEQMLPESVLTLLRDQMSTLHAEGGRRIGIPDDLWHQFSGQIIQEVTPPQLGQSFMNMIDWIVNEIDVMSGVNGVLRGEAKSEWRSGAMVDSLTDNARGPIGYKARHTAQAMRYAAKISAGLIVNYLPTEVWAKRNKKYPVQILEVMRRRLKTIGYDVSVNVAGASSKQSQANKLTQVLANNPQLANSPTFMGQWADQHEIQDADKIVEELTQAQAPPPPE